MFLLAVFHISQKCVTHKVAGVTCVFTPMAHKPKKQSITKSDRKEFLLGQCSQINVDQKLFISQLERHMLMSLF